MLAERLDAEASLRRQIPWNRLDEHLAGVLYRPESIGVREKDGPLFILASRVFIDDTTGLLTWKHTCWVQDLIVTGKEGTFLAITRLTKITVATYTVASLDEFISLIRLLGKPTVKQEACFPKEPDGEASMLIVSWSNLNNNEIRISLPMLLDDNSPTRQIGYELSPPTKGVISLCLLVELAEVGFTTRVGGLGAVGETHELTDEGGEGPCCLRVHPISLNWAACKYLSPVVCQEILIKLGSINGSGGNSSSSLNDHLHRFRLHSLHSPSANRALELVSLLTGLMDATTNWQVCRLRYSNNGRSPESWEDSTGNEPEEAPPQGVWYKSCLTDGQGRFLEIAGTPGDTSAAVQWLLGQYGEEAAQLLILLTRASQATVAYNTQPCYQEPRDEFSAAERQQTVEELTQLLASLRAVVEAVQAHFAESAS